MPIPLILGGLAVLGTAVGISAQADAKEVNEKAQRLMNEAQSLYDQSKQTLEEAQKKTEHSLLALGTSKKIILETSVAQFLSAYSRIKNIELSESIGLDEIQNFSIDKQDALQLQEMSNIYQSTFSSGAAGAATGAVIALAASGALPVVTGSLSIAGSALMMGEISAAVGLAGSALSFGAAMTPLAAIAAPAILFSGISSSIKADENLEKARTVYAEAEAACEQMKNSEILCEAIARRADMFDGLLRELNILFSQCTAYLESITEKKRGFFKKKTVDARSFTEEELKIVAVTRALAGAVKAVIDTPILTAEGSISNEADDLYEDTQKKLPAFNEAVEDMKNSNQGIRVVAPAAAPSRKAKKKSKKKQSWFVKLLKFLLRIVLGCVGLFILLVIILIIFG